MNPKFYSLPVEKQQAIVNAGFHVFSRNSYKKSPMSEIADAAGISRDRIILDPGIGFAKDYQQNLLLLKNLEIMTRWKLPVLLGTSRKSVIGKALDLPVDQREEGTAATTVLGRMKGASVFRVHDVRTNCRALRMIDQIMNAEDGSRETR